MWYKSGSRNSGGARVYTGRQQGDTECFYFKNVIYSECIYELEQKKTINSVLKYYPKHA